MTDIREELAREMRRKVIFITPQEQEVFLAYEKLADAALAWFRSYLQRQEVVERAAKATFAEYVARDPSCPLLSWDDAPGWERAMWKRRQVAALAAILPPSDAKTEKPE